MPVEDFYALMILDSMEPFIDRRSDIQAALVTSTLVNINRSSRSRPFSLSDFIPYWTGQEEKPAMDAEKQLETFLEIQKMQNDIQAQRTANA